MSSKLKIIWICHFSNEQIRQKMPLSNNHISGRLRKLVGKKPLGHSDFAPWITTQIKEFEKFKDVELHVIAPHFSLRPFTFEFQENGVYYHFFKPGLPLQMDTIVSKLLNHKRRKFRLNRFWIKRFINRINPDIIDLVGTESPYYSLSALDIIDKPVFVSVQTVYTNPVRKELSGKIEPLNWDTELMIHSKLNYYGCSGRMYRDLILNNNANAIIFKYFFPIQNPEFMSDVSKEYDFVCFAAKVEQKKGVEDAIDALLKAKTKKPDISLNIVGSCSTDYKNRLLDKIKLLGLDKNITFNDYFPKHSDMLRHIKKSKFALLPIKLDVIPGTIIEAILLELPVVSYKTTGTPYLNKDEESVLLADIGDIEKLADNMLKLLASPQLGESLVANAKKIVKKEFDNAVLAKRLVEIYHSVINHYYQKKCIPKELLFSTDEFPVY